ncbi:MAG: DNA polymerase III subunit gamma/tau [Candidatus Falkowbacteria bacterium]
MATLYQKYRPSNFTEIVNQNHIKITLQNEIETGDVAHAYLFCGPRGTGKTTMARVLAKALNCENRKEGESEPCSDCISCQQITVGTSLDIVEIDAASHTGVDNVRENIIANARIAISGDKYKVFIIDEVHMLSISAFNALLKILEEPPQQVIFILATTEVHKLPTTIISRCQRFDFKRIAVADIVKKLEYISQKEKVTVEQNILETIARHSDGHMRDAESLFGQIISISGKDVTQEKAELVIPQSHLQAVIDLIESLSNKDAAGAVSLINKLIDEGIDLKNFTIDVIETLRKMLLFTVSPQLATKFATDLGINMEEKMQPLADKIGTNKLVTIINSLIQAEQELKNSFIAQLPLEIAAVSLCNDLVTNTGNIEMQSTPVSSQTIKTQPNSAIPITPVSTTAPPQKLSIDLEAIKSSWNEMLLAIKKHNHSLSFIMRVCEPRIANQQLCLAFKYKFHKERLDQPTIKALVEKTLLEVFKTPISYTTITDETLDVKTEEVPVELLAEPVEASATPVASVQESTDVDKTHPSKLGGKDIDVKSVLDMFGGKVIN